MNSEGEEYSSDESDSDSVKKLEDELYSVIHHNDFSKGVPEELLTKYNIEIDEKGGISVSLKSDEERTEKIQDKEEEEEVVVLNLDRVESDSQVSSRQEKAKGEYVCISVSDSEEVVERRGTKRKIPLITIDDSSDEANFSSGSSDIIINTKPPSIVDISDDDDSLEMAPHKKSWRQLDSPPSWTSKMRKFYNKPLGHLRHFDHLKLIRQMKGHRKNWTLNAVEFSPLKCVNKPRCSICNIWGHLDKECFQRPVVCHMCGTPGHLASQCSERKCLNCGKKSSRYVTLCDRCKRVDSNVCLICFKTGHDSETCSDIWRRYHSTIGGESLSNEHRQDVTRRKFCSNCSQEGHLYEECHKSYWSNYPVTSSFVTNYEGPDNLEGTHRIYIPSKLSNDKSKLEELVQEFEGEGLKISVKHGEDSYFTVSGPFVQTKALQDRLREWMPRPKHKHRKQKRRGSSRKKPRRSQTPL